MGFRPNEIVMCGWECREQGKLTGWGQAEFSLRRGEWNLAILIKEIIQMTVDGRGDPFPDYIVRSPERYIRIMLLHVREAE